jgi:hypothetical protein
MSIQNIQVKCDAAPLMLFIKLLDRSLQAGKGRFDFRDFSFELVRVEANDGAAGTGELTVVLYPSDAFLRFAVTLCAVNFKF